MDGAPPQPSGLVSRLSAMFFIDVAVAGAYFPLLSLHLSKTLGLSAAEIAMVYAAGPLTALIGPPLVGWIADRLLEAERSLAVVALLRALALLVAARAANFGQMLLVMALVGLVSAPAGVLTFSIAFHHLPDSRSIGRLRVWGTVSWIAALWGMSVYMQRYSDVKAQLSHTGTIFGFAAAASFVSASYALTLPHTPPARTSARAFAFVDALDLLRERSFRSLVIAAALASACLQFHFMLWPLFYTDGKTGLGLDLSSASRWSSLAQVLELGLFPALALLIARFGLRRVLIVGMAAWPVRFAAYALGKPGWLVMGLQSLHSVTVVCGTVAGQVAVDRVAPRGARASSQALLVVASSGIGNLVGQLSCGAMLDAFALPSGGYAWPNIFALPLALGAAAVWLVIAGFRPVPMLDTPRVVAEHPSAAVGPGPGSS